MIDRCELDTWDQVDRYIQEYDIETGKIIKAHNRSKKILDKYQGKLIHQVIEDDDYVFTVAVCRKI